MKKLIFLMSISLLLIQSCKSNDTITPNTSNTLVINNPQNSKTSSDTTKVSIPQANLPVAIINSINSFGYNNYKFVSIYQTSVNNNIIGYDVIFSWKGNAFEYIFDVNGKYIYSKNTQSIINEVQINLNQIPTNITTYLTKTYNNYTITYAIKETVNGITIAYRLTIPGIVSGMLLFDDQGNFISFVYPRYIPSIPSFIPPLPKL